MIKPAATVYLVTNRANGKTYVGVTRFALEKRWSEHVWSSKRNPRSWLHRSIRKYGSENFTIAPLASCLSSDAAKTAERQSIWALAPVYNQTNGGEITVGRHAPRESIERAAAKVRGRKHRPESIAANRAKALARYSDNPGLRTKMSTVLAKARCLIDEDKRRAAVGRSARDRVWSAESRAKLSASCMGRRYGRDVLDKIAAKKRKSVKCIELKTVFESVSEAAKGTGLSIGGVSKVCLGQRNSANGLTFRFCNATN